jgi:hypothetical protein
MSEPAFHMPAGERPLVARVYRPKEPAQRQELTLPELHLVVGRDLRSSGVTITVWEPTGGVWPSLRYIYAARWLEPVLTTQGALRIAANSSAAALAELFGSDLPA